MKSPLLFVVLAACAEPHSTPVDAPPAIAKCTATPRKIVDSATFAPSSGVVAVRAPDVAIDAGFLYYTLAYQSPDGGNPTGHVMRIAVDRDGAAPEQVVDSTHPIHVMVAGDSVWFADDVAGGVYAISSGHSHLAANVASPDWLAHDDTTMYVADSAGIDSMPLAGGAVHHVSDDVVFSFGVIAGDVVQADFQRGTVSSVPVAGGSATPLASGQLGPLYPVSCGTTVCWVDGGNLQSSAGSLVAVAPGGASPLVTDARLYHPHGVVADAAHLFVAAEGAGVSRVAIDGSALATLAVSAGASSIALDDDCVYWSALDGLWSLRKDATAM
jgi:hypothetical protein